MNEQSEWTADDGSGDDIGGIMDCQVDSGEPDPKGQNKKDQADHGANGQEADGHGKAKSRCRMPRGKRKWIHPDPNGMQSFGVNKGTFAPDQPF